MAEGATADAPDTSKRPDAVHLLAKQYAEYLQVDVTKQSDQFDESIEDMLVKLDEYGGLVDLIRSDTSLGLQKTLPEIYVKSKEIEKIFEKVDKLEAFVAVVKQNVSVLEHDVEEAEAAMGSLSTIKKVFSGLPFPSFLSSKKSPTKELRSPTFEPPVIFDTAEFLETTPRSAAVKTSSQNAEASSPASQSSSSAMKPEPSNSSQSAESLSAQAKIDQSEPSLHANADAIKHVPEEQKTKSGDASQSVELKAVDARSEGAEGTETPSGHG